LFDVSGGRLLRDLSMELDAFRRIYLLFDGYYAKFLAAGEFPVGFVAGPFGACALSVI
jgi:hypothetical protein